MKKTDLILATPHSRDVPSDSENKLARPSVAIKQAPRSGPAVLSIRDSDRRVVEIRERIDREHAQQIRTQILGTARAVALSFLPNRPSKARQISRNIRLGSNLWVRVTYTTTAKDVPLPFGMDRCYLHGLLHYAILHDQPLITFDKAGELLDLFQLDHSGRSFKRLRDGLRRIAALHINIVTTDLPGCSGERGEKIDVIEGWHLPTRDERSKQNAMIDQMSLPGVNGKQDLPHFVRLSEPLMNHLREGGRNILLMRLDLLRHFSNRPIAFDLAMFLAARCGAAASRSVVPHDALMDMFKAGSEPDRRTIQRLQEYLTEIQEATGADQHGRPRLNARLEVISEERKGKGRPRKLWGLVVEPSRQGLVEKGASARATKQVLSWPEGSSENLSKIG